MATEIYIGTEKVDGAEDVTVLFTPGDIRELMSGRVASSYTITVPLTNRNRRLLKYNDEYNVFEEVTDTAFIMKDNAVILRGKLTVQSHVLKQDATIIIQGTGWTDHFKDARMRDLDLSAYNHEYNYLNINLSWNSGTKHYRYPLINFGRLFSQQTGATANWGANDFIPAFRIPSILAAIFYPWTLTGSILTDLAERYIVGQEPVATTDFITNKGLEARAQNDSDNDASATIPAGGPTTVTFTETQIILTTITTDEGSDFASSQYTVPETGTYYFLADFATYWNFPAYFTIVSQTLSMKIIRSRASVETALRTQTGTYTSTDILNTTYTLNSGWVHCEAGDLIYMKGAMTNRVNNTDGINRTCTIMFKSVTTKLYNLMDERCRYTGIGKTIVCKDWMPDVSQIDFVKAIKEAYNLKFTPDLFNQTVYVEAADVMRSDHVKYLTGVDFSSIESENIAGSYNSKIKLKFRDDTSDKAVSQVMDATGSLYFKDVQLVSEYAEKGEDQIENSLFAWTASGYIEQNNVFTPAVLRIFGGGDFGIFNYPEYRPTGFTPRLIKYDGLTSGFTWYVNGSSRSTYPKATTEDMSVLYPLYFQKTLHLIDRGKILKFRMKYDIRMLQEFMTVFSAVDEEGFNPMYEFQHGAQSVRGYLNKIEFQEGVALIEMIILH